MYRSAVVCTTIKLIKQIDNLYIRSLVIESCNHAIIHYKFKMYWFGVSS